MPKEQRAGRSRAEGEGVGARGRRLGLHVKAPDGARER